MTETSPVDLTVTVRDYGGHILGTGTITAAGTCPDGRCDPRKPVGVGTVDVHLQMANERWHHVGTYGPQPAPPQPAADGQAGDAP